MSCNSFGTLTMRSRRASQSGWLRPARASACLCRDPTGKYDALMLFCERPTWRIARCTCCMSCRTRVRASLRNQRLEAGHRQEQLLPLTLQLDAGLDPVAATEMDRSLTTFHNALSSQGGDVPGSLDLPTAWCTEQRRIAVRRESSVFKSFSRGQGKRAVASSTINATVWNTVRRQAPQICSSALLRAAQVLGACEKILRTPIYTPYTRFTSRFLFMLLALPCWSHYGMCWKSSSGRH